MLQQKVCGAALCRHILAGASLKMYLPLECCAEPGRARLSGQTTAGMTEVPSRGPGLNTEHLDSECMQDRCVARSRMPCALTNGSVHCLQQRWRLGRCLHAPWEAMSAVQQELRMQQNHMLCKELCRS